ncbi:hypothetical protein [Thermoleophilum album]|uniref:Uncharacterized protein n=1 Tax=Thermoleophilum album TaxID=29539 RepID=A0A1H6FK65_THEAL|nr:hypothetical protein [Thermoleophilum album]SEH10782.1 hypothetical protein SAMN02745716_0551 [Thermoleophilum album]
MNGPTALVVDGYGYYHPECCLTSETGDSPVAMYDDDLAHISGDISCEGCMQTLNGHLTDYAELAALNLAPGPGRP